MPVITVSSQFGAGGPVVGRKLAKRLGFEYLDKEIIHQVALGLDVPEEKVEEFDEDQYNRMRSLLSTIFDWDALKTRRAEPPEETPSRSTYDDREEIPYNFQVRGWIDRDIYKQMIVKVISAMGQRSAVVKGRGSQWILKDNPNALHVRFVASDAVRVARTSERRGLSADEARDLMEKMDQRGADYVRNYFGCDVADPNLYDVVLNSSRLSLDDCLEILVAAVERRFPSEGK